LRQPRRRVYPSGTPNIYDIMAVRAQFENSNEYVVAAIAPLFFLLLPLLWAWDPSIYLWWHATLPVMLTLAMPGKDVIVDANLLFLGLVCFQL
jgi:hypothetical protein